MRKTNKFLAIAIAIFFILSMVGSIILTPSANAHSPPWNIPTYAYVTANPNPAGIGQTVNIGFWIQIPPPTASGAPGDRWMNFMVTVTLPDGSSTKLGPFTSDDTGGTHADYTPTQIGNYTVSFSFPGQTLAGANHSAPNVYIGDYFEPSSATTTFTVQQTPIAAIPQNPLPTTYWSRPIESVNDLWYTESGNWLGFGVSSFANTGIYNITGNYNPYTLAPTTAHIIWTKPVAFGGLVGGEFGGSDTSNYYSTSQYEPKWAPIIMNGIMYYTNYPGSSTYPEGWTALNLQTGQTVWTSNTPLTSSGSCTILRCGQILDMVNPNQYGSIAYLWSTGTPAGINVTPGSTTFNLFDAMTGNYILSIVNGTAPTLMESQGGDLIGYFVNATVGTQIIGNTPVTTPSGGSLLEFWNSTQAILYPSSNFIPGVTTESWSWRPAQNSVIPFQRGTMWAAPLATNISGVALPGPLSISTVNSGVVLMTNQPVTALSFNTGFEIEAGYSPTTGAQLWIVNRTLTPYTRDSINKAGDGVYDLINTDTNTITGYSMTTGTQLWGPVTLTGENGAPPNVYSTTGGYQSVLANGVLYLMGFGGDVWAINMQTGAILWYTNTNKLSGSAGANTPYGVWPLWVFSGGTVADGLYFLNEGHEYSPPLFRGASQLAINATNGQLVWSIMAFDVTNAAAISDGIMTVENAYDNQIYAFGMGPSKTTVNSPNPVATVGSPIVFDGSVTDISAGSQQQAVAANFPNGLPCVSDASMTTFMEAAYMQQPIPTNVTGVPVTLSVLDSNNNYRTIGSTTTNALGDYTFTWKPDIPGNYTVYATFSGTQSYYGSTASTGFYATSPPSTSATTPSPASGLATENTLMYIGAAMIIVIIVIGAVLATIMLRKKP